MNVIYDLIIDNYGESIICFKEIRRSSDRYSLCFISLFEYSLGNLWIVLLHLLYGLRVIYVNIITDLLGWIFNFI